MRKLFSLITILALLFGLAACETVGFYAQAIGGQLSLMQARKPIAKLLADDEHSPELSPELRQQLELVQSLLIFADAELQLPVKKTYSSFAQLERDFVVWNVFATERFSSSAREWCYPVAGCASYRGYFKKAGAEKYAAKLSAKGYDVYVGGVKAYSTLGWFNDPVLDTFISYPEERLAALIFHELAHKVLYVKGDTEFNESFATAVEQVAVKRWFESQSRPAAFAEYSQRVGERRAFYQQVADLRERLQTLFDSTDDTAVLSAGKAKIFTEFANDFRQFEDEWQTGSRYQRWLASGANNAKLLPVLAYNRWVPALAELARRHELTDFYAQAKKLAQLEREEREQQLEAMLPTVDAAIHTGVTNE